MSGKVNVTLDARDVVTAIRELSAAGRRLVGAWTDAAVEKRKAIRRIVTALTAAHANPRSSKRIMARPILLLKESVRDDRDLIALVFNVGSVLINRGQKGFAVRLIDALLNTQDFEEALYVLENSCEVRWEKTITLGGYWRE